MVQILLLTKGSTTVRIVYLSGLLSTGSACDKWPKVELHGGNVKTGWLSTLKHAEVKKLIVLLRMHVHFFLV